jgi:predicted phage terminase large subunit-like protein
MNLTKNQHHALMRSDLGLFVREVFAHLNPTAEFKANWHIDLVASKLMAALRGDIKRLIICMPPRSMKSILGSVALPAWALGRDPTANILCVSYSQDLANKLSSDTRSFMMSPRYREIFPNTQLSSDRNAVGEFTTTRRGSRLATSVGGTLTGRGASRIIVDDALKPEEAHSDSARVRVNDWYGNTLISRLDNKETDVIIVIMQRLHEDDLVGYLQSIERWECVSLPAIAEEDERWEIESILGNYSHVRLAGTALHPERESPEVLESMCRAMGDADYTTQYLQRPSPRGGGLIKREWFQFYDSNQLPAHFPLIVQSWDCATKPGELSDYSVCTTWGLLNGHYYLVHVYRERLDFPSLKRQVDNLAQFWNPETILVEDKSSGIALIQELGATIPGLRAYKPVGDKVMRMAAQTAKIENGFVHLPKDAGWLPNYLHELETSPKDKYDDQVDSTSQALHWISTDGQTPGIIAYYQNEAARMNK